MVRDAQRCAPHHEDRNHVRAWAHKTRDVGFWGESRHAPVTPEFRVLTQCMVRPCVASGFAELAVSGLASMYPAFDWSICSGPSWISARVRSRYRTGLDWTIWVNSVRMRRQDRTSLTSHPLADLGWKLLIGL